MNFEKRKILLKVNAGSQFGYCALTWMFDSRKTNSKKKKKNHIHERAFPTVYKNSY